jgi:3-hydroxyisobutyrate dehydrogenase
MEQRVAFIGLGIMGRSMAVNLQRGGSRLTVHTRTPSTAAPLLESGAAWAATPAAAAREADVIFLCVPDTPDVRQVLLGEDGVTAGAAAGAVVVDHSTISPTATCEMAAALSARGIPLIDAPVSGGDVGAKNGTLSIMCGGRREAFDRVRPLLDHMGKTITYCGPSGNGQLTKLVNQILVCGTLLAVSEAITFAQRGGLDIATTLQAVGAGAAKSWQLEQLGPKMAAGDFAPGFMIDLMQKDLRLVREFAAAQNLRLPCTEMVQDFYAKLQATGDGRSGTQAMFKAISSINNDPSR